VSSRRRGRRFLNLDPIQHAHPLAVIKWGITREPGPWSRINAPPGKPPDERVEDLRVTLINHSTVLVQVAGLNLLTDPIWSERCSPVSFAGPRRYRPPGLRFEDLPPIDLVLVSHDHYDHLDTPTLRRLAANHRPRVLTGLGNGPLVRSCGLRARELDWWEHVEHDGARMHFVPAQHFSGRGLHDRDRTLWGGFVIETRVGSVYFAGDTGLGSFLADIRRRLGPPRLALLPIGGYLPRWFMAGVHVSPTEAAGMHHELGASTSVAIHYGCFRLADEAMDQCEAELAEALRERENARFWVLPHGEGRDVPPGP
jgi:L-ascorbate metabolism protein UlaG (beta-lactamase superfamily)